jgi:hypothetical protein
MSDPLEIVIVETLLRDLEFAEDLAQGWVFLSEEDQEEVRLRWVKLVRGQLARGISSRLEG